MAVDAARAMAGARQAPMDEDELAGVVSELARAGSVQAAKLRWEMLRAAIAAEDQADPLVELDRLALRRLDPNGSEEDR